MTLERDPSRPSHTWPKSRRLRKRREYLVVQRDGRRCSTRDLVILWMPGRGDQPRLGITVSRKVAKQACRRNRIKRCIREAYRQLEAPTTGPVLDVVVIARPRAVHASYQELRQQLAALWQSRPPRCGPPRA